METLIWPVTTGCENIGGGCESCPSLWEYREKGWDYSIREHPESLYVPMFVNTPVVFAVAFGSDLFHKDVSTDFIKEVFKIMNRQRRHLFEVITKRSERLLELSGELDFTNNIYLGVTVEDSAAKFRIKELQGVPAQNKYISFMPLLGPVGEVDLKGINVAVVKAEDWGLKRPCNPAWIEAIKGQCLAQGVEVSDGFYLYKSKLEVEKCRVLAE